MNLIEEFKADVVGIALIRDWLGAGGNPVSQPMAEARAAICLNCPKHQPGAWWEAWFKNPVARAIKRTLEYKNRLSLELYNEKALGNCTVCRCCLVLKCWVPTEHVKEHTPPERLAEFPEFCWIRSELEAMKGNES